MDLLKVFFIDDEFLIRKLLANCVDWKDLGYEIAGESEGRQHALDSIAEIKPSLIFVDINMPVMNGIDLSKKILAIHPSAKIVILTGHQDFDNARDAIKFGAFDFLLKPVNPEEITKVALKVQRIIEKRRLHLEMVSELKERVKEGYPWLRAGFISELLEGNADKNNLEDALSYYDLELNPTKLQVAVLAISSTEDHLRNDDYLIQNLGVAELLKTYIEDKPKIYFALKDNKIVLISNELNSDLGEYIEGFVESLSYVEYTISAGVSSVIEDLVFIHSAYLQAKEALNNRMIRGEGLVISYDEITNNSTAVMNYDLSMEELCFFIKAGLVDEALTYLNDELMKVKGGITLNNLIAMGMRVISECYAIQTEFEINISDIECFFLKVSRVKTLPDLKDHLSILIEQVSRNILKQKKYKSNSIITEVKTYIDNNVNSPDLSLKAIAAKFYLNASYLSRIFKNEVQMTFIEYVKNKRMDMALEILRNEDCKLYQVADKVGITDPHYFGILFKKHTGMTVSEYKSKIKRERL